MSDLSRNQDNKNEISSFSEKSIHMMTDADFFELLTKVNIPNYDNGKKFKRTDRLDVIGNLLWNTAYRRVNPQGLFHLYAKKPLEQIERRPVIISTHTDCQKNITRCFTAREKDSYLRGTFDNSATNASVLALMLENRLPEYVLVAFTGDEEEDSRGAHEVVHFLKEKNLNPELIIVLDVTDMGWEEKCLFTIENNFFSSTCGEKIVEIAVKESCSWLFVPSDPDDIPAYVPKDKVLYVEAEPDESWDYDELKCSCFSLCLPTCGNMHSNDGVLLRENSLAVYRSILEKLSSAL